MSIVILDFPKDYFSLSKSQSPEFLSALKTTPLNRDNLDQTFEHVQGKFFNQQLRKIFANTIPQIQEVASQSAFLSKCLTPFITLMSHPQGTETFNLLEQNLSLYIKNHLHTFDRLRNIDAILDGSITSLKTFRPHQHFPKKQEWKQFDTLLEKIKHILPDEVSSWRQTLQQHPDAVGLSSVKKQLGTFIEQYEKGLLPFLTGLSLDLREISQQLYCDYEKKVTRLLTEECKVCHKKRDFSPALPFVETLLKCGRCKKAIYCSPECQRADWPQHKLVCKQ